MVFKHILKTCSTVLQVDICVKFGIQHQEHTKKKYMYNIWLNGLEVSFPTENTELIHSVYSRLILTFI